MITDYNISKRLIEIYNKIASNTEFKFATEVMPIIRKTDYDIGFINRYFFRQVNNIATKIIEVDKKQWTSFASNSFYLKVSLRWKITGRRDVVYESNLKSLNEANKVLPGVLDKLQNDLLQFYKP